MISLATEVTVGSLRFVMSRFVINGKEVTRVPTGASFRARFKYPYIIIAAVPRCYV
jgi:hypothetical protein